MNRCNGTKCRVCGGGKCICRNYCIKCFAEVILPQENGLCIECDDPYYCERLHPDIGGNCDFCYSKEPYETE